MPASRVAPLVDGWRRQFGGRWPGTSIPASSPETAAFPDVPLDIGVAIWVDESWIDVTPWVYGGERTDIQIRRGRSAEGSRVDPSIASMQVNNRDGQFSPRNPLSWLYGKIGRNTPIRVAIGGDMRFVGEVSEWPQRWDTTGTDVYVPIEASGVLRRLTQGATPVKSTLYRALTGLANPPKAYWPCEDGTDATKIASAVGGTAMTFTGSPDFAAHTAFKCSAALPTFNGSRWTGIVPSYPATGKIQVRFLMQVPSGGSVDAATICTIRTTGTAAEWRLLYEAGAGGDFTLQAYDANGAQLFTLTDDYNIDGDLVLVAIGLEEVAGDVEWTLRVLEVGADAAVQGSNTLTTDTIGRCTSVSFNTAGSHTDVAVGHVSVHDDNEFPTDVAEELNALSGEAAGRRIERLCAAEGVEVRIIGDVGDTKAMGPQLPEELVKLLRDAADADGGVLYEPRDFLGLAYRTRASLYNQAAAMTLDYSAGHLSAIEPTDDDQHIRNDVTIKRTDGSSARAVKEAGPLSIQAPPGGVGRYDEEVTLNLASDGVLADQASWRVHLGTVDETRYPMLGVSLARQPFVDSPPLAAAARALDVGDRLVVDNPPSWLPPAAISQLAQGFTEVLSNFEHRIDVNCAPESPWANIGAYSDGEVRYESQGTTLAEDLDSSETGVDVAVAGPLWTTAAADLPFNIRVGGEQMTVTAVAGAASPQTFTVTRSVNGVAKTHAAGAMVELDPTFVYAL